MSDYLKWHLIILKDPKALPGESIINVIQLMLSVIEFKYVILDYFDGAGGNGLMTFLQEHEDTVMDLSYLLSLIGKVTQFDWGDFFLLRNIQNIGTMPKAPFILLLYLRLILL